MGGWFPENISTYGGQIDSMFLLIAVIVGVWFVLAEIVLLACAVRFRRGAAPRARYFRGERWRELAWVLVPAALVLALDLGLDAASEPVWALVKEWRPGGNPTVRMTAKQFNWAVTHAGPDGRLDTEDDLTLENELHVEAGRDVQLLLESKDVIHSFFVPNLRLKQDVVPGRAIPAWFNATKPGRYEMPCAELCGFGHSGMLGYLIVHDPEDYRRWVAERWPAGAAPALAAAAATGDDR